MMDPEDIKKILIDSLPGAEVQIEDLNGGRDHFKVEVRSALFAGLSLIDQHRKVQEPLKTAVDDGRIHALTIKTVVLK